MVRHQRLVLVAEVLEADPEVDTVANVGGHHGPAGSRGQVGPVVAPVRPVDEDHARLGAEFAGVADVDVAAAAGGAVGAGLAAPAAGGEVGALGAAVAGGEGAGQVGLGGGLGG
ncbi:hypothetical protein C1I99_09325 [Micromonospora deserti]|uniref:Uncharacterized protein n=1 Tax=Micromonospora deserti TaxID=2070366 RepID=A0A2W2E6T4_9ACTN|nr:hypothetical protein C1I99_09325 [Micromonospora deserti]